MSKKRTFAATQGKLMNFHDFGRSGLPFWRPKRPRNHQKTKLDFRIGFWSTFVDFCTIWAPFWEAKSKQKRPKVHQKSKLFWEGEKSGFPKTPKVLFEVGWWDSQAAGKTLRWGEEPGKKI